MNSLLIYSLVAFFSGMVGNELGHFTKKVQRKKYGKFAVGAFSGFASMLLVLMIHTRFQAHLIPTAIIVGVFYGYFMANGKAFESIK